MNESIIILYLCLFGAHGVLVIVYLAKAHNLLGYLRDNEPETWESLGKPHLIFNNTVFNGLKFLRFMYKKEYLTLSNPVAREKAHAVKLLLTMGFIGFAILAGVLLVVFVVLFPNGKLV